MNDHDLLNYINKKMWKPFDDQDVGPLPSLQTCMYYPSLMCVTLDIVPVENRDRA